MLINSSLLEEIDEKKKVLDKEKHKTAPFISKRHTNDTYISASIHSARLEEDIASLSENEREQFKHSTKNNICKYLNNRGIIKAAKHIQDAIIWGTNNLYPGKVNGEFICNLSGKIDPVFHKNGIAKYREMQVRPSGALHSPPYPAKIPYEMDDFLLHLNNLLLTTEIEKKKENFKDAVKAAVYSHLHLVRIHPFEDTNGRSSRALQNIILKHYHFPPATILGGEKIDYHNRLNEAIDGYERRKGTSSPIVSKEEMNFYNYLAGKINSNLDSILCSLKNCDDRR